jgi:hypothetical protein
MFQHLAPARSRQRHVGADEAVPVGVIALNRVMQHNAAEERALPGGGELHQHRARRVARRPLQRQMLIERLVAVDHLRKPRLHHRQHAVAEGTADRLKEGGVTRVCRFR